MAEYIKRESAIDAVLDVFYDTTDIDLSGEKLEAAILNVQAADVETLVRCKDCKYWQDNNDGYPHEECRWGHGETPYANDFCSYGERKEGAD